MSKELDRNAWDLQGLRREAARGHRERTRKIMEAMTGPGLEKARQQGLSLQVARQLWGQACEAEEKRCRSVLDAKLWSPDSDLLHEKDG